MRTDVTAPADYQLRDRSATVTLYPTSTPQELIEGTASGGVDLSSMAAQIDQSDDQATIRLRYHTPPTVRPGGCLQIKIGADIAFNGIVESYARSEARGSGDRQMTVKVRRRDALPTWRDWRRMTELYSVGTDLGVIAREFAAGMGLASSEYSIPNAGIPLAHDAWQAADLTAWQIQTQIMQPWLAEPLVNALGVLKVIDRDVRRNADLALTDRQIVSMERNAGRPPTTAARLKWKAPDLAKVSQQEQLLTSAQLTAGFFKRNQAVNVWWSNDKKLRAENVRLHRAQSINQGVMGFLGDETLEDLTPYGGKIQISSSVALDFARFIGAMALLKAGDLIGDAVSGPGVTTPVGRVIRGISELGVWAVIFSLGQGIYEIYGTPYDYVEVINETEAYDKNAPAWFQKLDEFQNDLVPNESVAQALATNELIYRNREAANKGTLTILDDLRIEPGDLLELPDSSKFYVQGYSRSLGRGAEATLDLQGFFV